MLGAIFVGTAAFVIWVYYRILKLVVVVGWWVASHLFKLDRHTHLPGSKPVSFYVKRAMTHRRTREREAVSAKAAQPWAPTESMDAKVAFMDGETVTSIAGRLHRDRQAVTRQLESMSVITHDQAAHRIEKYPGLRAALELMPLGSTPSPPAAKNAAPNH